MNLIISRKEAHATGMRHFYTGKTCKNGHDAQRYVTTGSCVECNKMYMQKFNRDTRLIRTARLRNLFAYQLHPDDFAAALAYCQSLDMSRGLMPSQGVQYKPANAQHDFTPPTPEQIRHNLKVAFPNRFPDEPEPYMPAL